MSAYVVNPDHINYLVRAVAHYAILDRSPHIYHYGPDGDVQMIAASDYTELGRMLLAENLASVRYRYPTHADLPGPVPTPDASDYRYRLSSIPVSPAQVFKAVHGYEYQSCEHPQWHDSAARTVCQWLVKAAMRHAPGYDDAMWEITESEYADKVAAKRAEIAARTA